jgi:pyruvate, orthophosphate dikinase
MTSHAALVARGWGKCCIVGAGACTSTPRQEDHGRRQDLKEGDWITLNGTKGTSTRAAADDRRHREPPLPEVHEDGATSSAPWACAPTPTRPDAAKARAFGAEGIGLFRTEHMFYGKGSDEPLFLLRKMILSKTVEERKKRAGRAVPVRQEATSRPRWRRWTACR